jgi:NADPH oxidase
MSIRLWFRLFIVNDLATIFVIFIWLALNILLFIGQFLNYHQSRSYFYLRVLISDGVSVARASALCINFNCLLILLPVCRNLLSLIRYLLPRCITQSRFRRFTIRLFDQHVEFHRCVGYAICFWSLVHVAGHVYNYERLIYIHNEHETLASVLNFLYLKSPQSQINPFSKVSSNTLGVGAMLSTIGGITGVVLCVCLLVMVSSSTALIRRSFYEIFWFIHHLFIVFFICLILHGLQGLIKSQTNIQEHNPDVCAPLYRDWGTIEQCRINPRFSGSKPTSWMWLCGPLGLYILERILRFIRSLQHVKILNVIRHESNVMEIRFVKKSMTTPQPGQYIYLKCFSLAKFEWHPFTVTSAAEEDYVSVHIRTIGNWTKELAKKLEKYPQNIPRLSIDGPYGSPADDVFNYDGVVLVGAGIGGRNLEKYFCSHSNLFSLSSNTLCCNIKTYSFIPSRSYSTSSCLFLLDM